MTRTFFAILLALSLVACGSSGDDAPAPGHARGPFATGPSEPTPAPAPTTSPTSARRSRDPEALAHGAYVPIVTGARTTTERVEVPSTGDAPAERDLGAELATAIGSPASCIDLETARALHGRLTIRVTATLMATGSITRASASGSGLSGAAIDCVEDRVLHAHVAAPVERAPRSVSTTLEYDVTTTDDQVTTITPDIPTRPGAVAPAIVTPAIAPEGRVEGSVTPSSTLPARGPSGRPEGTVAPDIVLPARAD